MDSSTDTPQHTFGQVIRDFIQTVFSTQFWNSVKGDVRDIYTFYLDEQSRKELGQMKPIRRSFRTAFLILRALYSKLTPLRQALFILSLVLFLLPQTQWSSDHQTFNMHWAPFGFLVLLFILLLELKDKLLAKDELRIGHKVQEALMPRETPKLSGWDLWLFTKPANDVSGDLVDYLSLTNRSLDVTLADVAGKGLGAALLASKLQATLRALAPEFTSLKELTERVNAIFCRDGLPSRFATLVYARLETDSGAIRLMNAGHLSPLILRPQSIEQLPHIAPAIGLTSEAKFVEQEIILAQGEYSILFSDGVSEARNETGDFFGEERFRALVSSLRGLPAETMGRRIIEEVDRFVGSSPRSDDISLVIVKKL